MAKRTKKSLIKSCDALCSQIIRSLGRCEKCGRTENLQTHHVYGRANYRLRFDLRNLVCLCPRCHIQWAEQNPLEFADWIEYYRPTDCAYLREENKKGTIQRTLDDYLELEAELKEELERVKDW